eukprot:TRINITY_DN24196_c0_g1_i1.p1 TRINITY_DN24196_c0_g1~~TRINITY_DN24196_c0_g1_i1.p1  ORF type:complete len:329 (-),score=54.69 TRINITY_DN24196_c0_g1_i1:234-1220(-)
MARHTRCQRLCLVAALVFAITRRFDWLSDIVGRDDASASPWSRNREVPTSSHHSQRTGLAFSVSEHVPDILSEIPIVVAAVCAPAIAMLIGGLFAGSFDISEFGLCASQYFSAGMILAVCGSLMKELSENGAWAAAALSAGFTAGIATMVGVKKLTESDDDDEAATNGTPQALSSPRGFPWPYVTAVAIDSLVDGLLLGMVGVETPRDVPMMSLATALEMGALGLSCAGALAGQTKRSLYAVIVGMPLTLMAGGAVGAYAAAHLRNSPLAYTFLLAFGISALLYLVIQELLVEAGERREGVDKKGVTPYYLFAGYLFVLVVGMLESGE